MNFNPINFISLFRSNSILFSQLLTVRHYAAKKEQAVSMLGGALKKKKLAKMGPIVEKKVLPVETDPVKLVTYCCGSNIYKTGEDVKLKPDSEYPEWLWALRTGPAVPLEELDPESKTYWRRVKKMAMKRNNKLLSIRKF